jgi:hypothetical protein
MQRQSCAACAWRENCAKRFCISDGGARCPDFCRDVSIKDVGDEAGNPADSKEQSKK